MRLSSAFNPIFLTLLSQSYISVSSRSLNKHRRNNFNLKVSINKLLCADASRVNILIFNIIGERKKKRTPLETLLFLTNPPRRLFVSFIFQKNIGRLIWFHTNQGKVWSLCGAIFSAKWEAVKRDVQSAHTARDLVSISQDVSKHEITTFRMPDARSTLRWILGMSRCPGTKSKIAHRGIHLRRREMEETETFASAANQVGVIHPRLSFAFSVSSGSLTSQLRSTASIPYRNQMLRRPPEKVCKWGDSPRRP